MQAARLQRIISLAAPMVAAMVSGNILNLVDTMMVGTLGNSALAAVGIGSFASFLCFAPVLGVATGVQAIAARRKGQERFSEMAVSLNSGLLYSILIGVPSTVILYFLVPLVFPYINSDPGVVTQGVPYLRIQVLIIVLIGFKFAFRGYWNAIDLSRLYMWTLLVMHGANLLLNYLLIFGKFGLPALGVVGAGLGTALAHVVGIGIYFYLGWTRARPNGFLGRMPSLERLREVARLALPSGAQQCVMFAGVLVMYKIIGLLGTAEVAAISVLINVSLVALLPALGLGVAATTLVGQALGRKEPRDASRWAWQVVQVTAVLLAVLATPLVLLPGPVLALFLHDPVTLELARMPLQVGSLSLVMEGVAMVLMQSLLGAGDVRRVLAVVMTIQLFNLPMIYLIGPVMGYGLVEIAILGAFVRLTQALVFALMWRGGRWAGIEV